MVTWIDSAKQLVDIIIETQNIPDEFNGKVEIKKEFKTLHCPKFHCNNYGSDLDKQILVCNSWNYICCLLCSGCSKFLD